ncbi:cell wall-binding repeat-containing protein [Peptacetobacter hiranonis]|uniref:cell wall-binding repeat-containing protein n=1 Tax=Peptacetobacter hiranonis TaxID=89152 RepID=UPI002E76AF4E|nr:cell wall-binding repeat-containing protein [Peptacetobacter hiranonis]MEE0248476.1 cell wall-binding repeat-containing protein [Peptacetobacter hiranonis]
MKKKLATVMAATMAVSGSVVSVSAATTSEQLVGADRADTAVKISKDGWKSAETVILVNDSAIPDALTATPLAYAKNAPILLTAKGGLTKATANEIKRLGAKDVIMIGGDAVLPTKIENELKALNVKTDRVKGSTREETALAIAKRLDGIKDISEIAVVNGTTGLADAVSVAAAAAEKGMPILLANPKSGLSAVEKFINSESIKTSFVIGGDEAVSDEAIAKLPGKQRIEGSDRNDTNAKVIEKFYTDKELDNLYLAKDGMENSGQLIDALAVGALAAKNGAPVLIASKKLNVNQINVINTKKIATITQVGGEGNEKAFNELKEIEKAEVIKVKNEAELQEALKKANANDTIEIDANATISKDVTLSTNNAIEINVKGDLTGKVTVKTPNADIKNSGTIGTLVVENGKNTTVTNTSAGKISKVEVSSSSENVKVENNGTITEVKNDGEGTKVENDGTISKPITGTETPNIEGNKPGGSTGSSTGSGNVVVDGPEVERVTNETELRNALTKTEKTTIKLNNSIEVKGKINIPRSMTLDLNGYTLTQTSKEKDKTHTIVITTDGVILNIKNGEINIPDSTSGNETVAIFVSGVKQKDGSMKITKDVTVNMTGVNIKMGGFKFTDSNNPGSCDYANLFGVYANGTCEDISFDIDRCNISGAAMGVYFPAGSKKIDITSSTIIGGSAVGIKGGTGIIKNSTLIGTGLSSDAYIAGLSPSGSGINEAGEALVVEGNYSDRGMDIKVENSNLESKNGYGVRMQFFGGVDKKLSITGGNIKGALGSIFDKHADNKNETYSKNDPGKFETSFKKSGVTEETTKTMSTITKGGNLVTAEDGSLSTSFTWASETGAGSKGVKESGDYKYYDNGVYLRFQVKEGSNVKKFNEVFATADGDATAHKDGKYAKCGMTLQTEDGPINDMEGSNREKYDWGVSEIEEKFKTELPNAKSNYIFYGVKQENSIAKTVGFNPGDSRKINMVLRPKADLADGTYTVTVELVQQGNEGKSLGTIDYTFNVNNGTITVK